MLAQSYAFEHVFRILGRSIDRQCCRDNARFREGPRSEDLVVAYLGDLTPSGQDGWVKLGAHLQGDEAARRPQRTLFDPPWATDAGEQPELVGLDAARS
jgi:hypothetical protein